MIVKSFTPCLPGRAAYWERWRPRRHLQRRQPRSLSQSPFYFAPSSGYTDLMADPSDHPIARAIEASTAGDSQAASRLVPLFYDELRRLARSLLARNPRGQTIQATALVHEAYLRIVGKDHVAWHGRRQFFATAAQAMRDILVEEARRKASLKRGGDRERVPLDGEAIAMDSSEAHVLDIDEALTKLEKLAPPQGADRPAPLLRRAQCRRDRGRSRRLGGNGRARVAVHPGMALARVEWGRARHARMMG